jgi:hypothetical protein
MVRVPGQREIGRCAIQNYSGKWTNRRQYDAHRLQRVQFTLGRISDLTGFLDEAPSVLAR